MLPNMSMICTKRSLVLDSDLKKFKQREGMGRTLCVTGAGGYIGSWLIKCLLEKGHYVHATLRDPENPAKTSYLVSLPGAEERLKLFRADLGEDGSFDAAVADCDGVFHLAMPLLFHSQNPEEDVIEPAMKGTINVLNSCVKVKTVKRLVYTSSISTISAMDCNGNFKHNVDESCWISLENVKLLKPNGWVYVMAKTLAEKSALRFAKEHDIEMVSIISVTVAGRFLTSTVPTSVSVLLSLVREDPGLYEVAKAVEARLGCLPLVHIEDVCNAHIFLMESLQRLAGERYICCGHCDSISALKYFMSQRYPDLTKKMNWEASEMDVGSVVVEISSRKLVDLGFRYQHGVEEIVKDAIEAWKESKGICKTD